VSQGFKKWLKICGILYGIFFAGATVLRESYLTLFIFVFFLGATIFLVYETAKEVVVKAKEIIMSWRTPKFKSKVTKYCDIDPKFPRNAWAGFMLMRINGNTALIPAKRIYLTKQEEKLYLKIVHDAARKEPEVWMQALVKLKFAKLIKNKRKMWTKVKKQTEIDALAKMLYYVDVFNYPALYQLLAIGIGRDDEGKWEWGLMTRFLKGTDQKKIEQFMCGCNEKVDERCKYSAVYDVEEIIFVRPNGKEEKHYPNGFGAEEVLN